MKLTKIAGAFALTAAMAMSAVPAFAAVGTDNVENFKEATSNTSNATTKVYAETVNASLNATIPTRVAVVLPSSGAGDVQCPTSEAYKIINKSATPIYLRTIESAGMGFQLKSSPDTSGNFNSLAMKVNAGSFEAALDGTAKQGGATAPEIAGNNGELGLALSGKSWVGQTLSASQLDSAIMTITYTIGTSRS